MSLNTEIRFSEIPSIEKSRSTFDRSFSHKTTVNSADIVPLMWSEVLPGDTIQIDFSHVTRMTTPIAPVADNAFLDVFAFYTPTRLLWEHWEEFWGENKTTYWEQPIKYKTPKLSFSDDEGTEVKPDSLINYLGIPVGYKENEAVRGKRINAFPLRCYCKIYNDWFRDENLKQPLVEHTGDETTLVDTDTITYDEANSYVDVPSGAYCARAAKVHDYFTSALPAPLKSDQVTLLGGMDGFFPVNTLFNDHDIENNGKGFPIRTTSKNEVGGYKKYIYLDGGNSANQSNGMLKIGSTNATVLDPNGTVDGSHSTGIAVVPTNLWADLSNATVSTISQLRTAFAIQRFFEAQARGGSRYCEFLSNIFGCTNLDARLQRSEFIGSKRFNINIDQVLQTSGTGATGVSTPQGNTAAYSCTVNADDLCTYSASEHGYIMVLGVIRTEHSYSQGISKEWLRDSWEDYYIPQFAHLSEQAVKEIEIYAQGNEEDDEVFGYQEAWSEYRYKPNMITGKLSPQAEGSLDIWHYGDYYTAKPTLSAEWINETPNNIARTLAVQNEPQFIMDCYFAMKWTRVMPLYSVPGLIDHM